MADGDYSQEFGVPKKCAPVWNKKLNQWVYASYLGNCEQEVSTANCTEDGLVCSVGVKNRYFKE